MPVLLVRRIVLEGGKLFYRRAPENQSELVRVEPARFALTGYLRGYAVGHGAA